MSIDSFVNYSQDFDKVDFRQTVGFNKPTFKAKEDIETGGKVFCRTTSRQRMSGTQWASQCAVAYPTTIQDNSRPMSQQDSSQVKGDFVWMFQESGKWQPVSPLKRSRREVAFVLGWVIQDLERPWERRAKLDSPLPLNLPKVCVLCFLTLCVWIVWPKHNVLLNTTNNRGIGTVLTPGEHSYRKALFHRFSFGRQTDDRSTLMSTHLKSMQCFNDYKCCLFCTLVALIFSDAASCHVSMSVQIHMFEGSRERERER